MHSKNNTLLKLFNCFFTINSKNIRKIQVLQL